MSNKKEILFSFSMDNDKGLEPIHIQSIADSLELNANTKGEFALVFNIDEQRYKHISKHLTEYLHVEFKS